MKKPNCYECKYRGTIPGDCHSCCKHPETKMDDNPMSNLMAMFASVGRSNPQIGQASIKLNIEANEHGIRSAWFNWPWNFDPVWLKRCDGFEKK